MQNRVSGVVCERPSRWPCLKCLQIDTFHHQLAPKLGHRNGHQHIESEARPAVVPGVGEIRQTRPRPSSGSPSARRARKRRLARRAARR